jgi:hypothetical protein
MINTINSHYYRPLGLELLLLKVSLKLIEFISSDSTDVIRITVSQKLLDVKTFVDKNSDNEISIRNVTRFDEIW